MKHLLFVFIFTFPAFADQGAILGTARDKKLIELKKKLTTYCEESHPQLLKEKESLFLCYLQLQADAKYSDEIKKAFSVTIINEARYLENLVIDLHGSASQVSSTYIGKEMERIENPCKFNPELQECKIYGEFPVMPRGWTEHSKSPVDEVIRNPAGK